METPDVSLSLTVPNCLPVSAGCRGHGGVRHGHRQAQREVRHPSLHQQVHGELLPGERACRCTCCPVCWGYSQCLELVSVFQSKSLWGFFSLLSGRDDKPADCIVYFGFSDVFRVSTMVVMENVGQQKLRQMAAYCQNIDR